MPEVILVFYAIMSAAGFLIMAADKRKAKNREWRISEKTLWLVSIAGGAWGAWIGMYTVRHKTKHAAFMIGMPFLSAAHLGLAIYLYAIL
ncbi:DUF1294 domain-containing protein [Metabacillus sp. 113a]|uniref:DUF1294 domain-containing protein n=1 Tax=Metabacillus sp. 113a TaxID=3404706 RepID=UPI003CE7CC43